MGKDNRQKFVLIIEDEPAIAQMYQMKLELADYHVETAPDGKTGLKIIDGNKPDLVLLDIMMPHMSGDEVLNRIRSNPDTEDMPVIILTNVGNEELEHKIERLGVTNYIQKSDLTPKQVLAKVNAAVFA